MLVKRGGWKKKLPALKLDPSGSMAMKESRYPSPRRGCWNWSASRWRSAVVTWPGPRAFVAG
ncbi:MAG: hypothetical protein CM1200mP2_31710 [Planctomycetaceae bacterium]|nr:MAG: hypothetical protein CM1200mP2_31710 [Planctomycetaceae bacterium]